MWREQGCPYTSGPEDPSALTVHPTGSLRPRRRENQLGAQRTYSQEMGRLKSHKLRGGVTKGRKLDELAEGNEPEEEKC